MKAKVDVQIIRQPTSGPIFMYIPTGDCQKIFFLTSGFFKNSKEMTSSIETGLTPSRHSDTRWGFDLFVITVQL